MQMSRKGLALCGLVTAIPLFTAAFAYCEFTGCSKTIPWLLLLLMWVAEINGLSELSLIFRQWWVYGNTKCSREGCPMNTNLKRMRHKLSAHKILTCLHHESDFAQYGYIRDRKSRAAVSGMHDVQQANIKELEDTAESALPKKATCSIDHQPKIPEDSGI